MRKKKTHIIEEMGKASQFTHAVDLSYPGVQIQSQLTLTLMGMTVETQPIWWFLPIGLVQDRQEDHSKSASNLDVI